MAYQINNCILLIINNINNLQLLPVFLSRESRNFFSFTWIDRDWQDAILKVFVNLIQLREKNLHQILSDFDYWNDGGNYNCSQIFCSQEMKPNWPAKLFVVSSSLSVFWMKREESLQHLSHILVSNWCQALIF